jgi:hypothetical protein
VPQEARHPLFRELRRIDVSIFQKGSIPASPLCTFFSSLLRNLESADDPAAIIALFRVMNRYVGNLPPMPGVFPDYPAPVVTPAPSAS